MHPNDTLQGKLVDSEWERPEERHLRNKFGYWRMVEKRMIRAQIVAEGGDPDNVFEVSRRVEQNHKHDLSLREWQALHPVKQGPKTSSAYFTDEELMNLLDRYQGANDPVSQSILAKIRGALL